MLISSDKLIGLSVETQSKQALGKLDGLIFEIESQSIYQYQVKPGGIAHMFDQDMLISREQIVSVTDKKIVVEDAVYLEQKEAQTAKTPLQTGVAAKT